MQPTCYPLRFLFVASPQSRWFEGLALNSASLNPSNVLVSPEMGSADGFATLVSLIIAATSCGSHALGFEPTLVADDQFPSEMGDSLIEGLASLSLDSLLDGQEPETFAVQVSGPNLAERPVPVDETKLESVTASTRPIRAIFGPTSCVREGVIVGSGDTASKVAVKFSWERVGENYTPEAETIQRIDALGVPHTVKLVGYKRLASPRRQGYIPLEILGCIPPPRSAPRGGQSCPLRQSYAQRRYAVG